MAERQLERERGIADQMGIMGLREAQLGQNLASLGQLGTAMGREEQGFLFDLGERERAQRQAGLDAVRQTQLQQMYEPYQRYGFLSDIFKGAPSSQQTLLQAASPAVSPFPVRRPRYRGSVRSGWRTSRAFRMMNRGVMSRQMFAKGGAAGFPDMNNDGNITQADILMGRGVEAQGRGRHCWYDGAACRRAA